jgi:uncharacterized damage-inducible protein DinB
VPTAPQAGQEVLSLLKASPVRLAAATERVPAERLHTPPEEGSWSANDVLAHLRSCADVWGDCIHAILQEDAPTIRADNPRTWIEQTDYPELEFHASLRAFAAQRAELVAVLEPLPTEAWLRGATVTGAGRPLQRTVLSYAQWLATHERPHVKQVERAIAHDPSS